MKYLWSLAALCAGLAAPLQADPIQWSYSWTASPSVIASGNSVPSALFLPGEGTTSAAGSGFLSTPIYTSPSILGKTATYSDVPYKLTLTITDKDTGLSKSASFTGTLSGNVGWWSDTLANKLTSSAKETLHIGHHLYDISFVGFLKPEPMPTPGVFYPDPTSSSLSPTLRGAFVFHVNVHHNPEPSSLVLAGLGLPALAGAFWRRRAAA